MSDSDDCRSVLIEVLTILAKDLDKFVVVGGWVPELAMPGQGHMGSLDVDLALDPKKLEPLVYESIRKKLIDAGYQQAAELPSRFFRDVKDGALQVKIDLITGEFPNLGEQGRQLQIQDMAVSRLRGIELAFEFQQGVEVEGVLPTGGHNRVVARLPTIPAFLCIKAIAMSERMKPKDAYDIYFCVDNYSGGYKALANEFRATLSHPLIREESQSFGTNSEGSIVLGQCGLHESQARLHLGRQLMSRLKNGERTSW